MKLSRVLALGLLCAAPTLVCAQWQWIDKSGRKVYSDQAPPADIPAKNILKQPSGKGMAAVAQDPAPAVAPVASAASAVVAKASAPAKGASGPKVSGKDKELEEKKKKAEAAQAEKRKADEEQLGKQRADNCSRAKLSKADYEAGHRIARTNEKGEREILDDAQRAAEIKRLESVIASDCKNS